MSTQPLSSPEPAAKQLHGKFITLLRTAFSRQNRVKSIVILAALILVIAAVIVIGCLSRPESVAARYVEAYLVGDISGMRRLQADPDLNYQWRSIAASIIDKSEIGETPEDFFDAFNKAYDEDVSSWAGLTKVWKSSKKETYIDIIGEDYQISVTPKRSKKMSREKFSSTCASCYFGMRDSSRFDIENTKSFKSVEVSVRLKGDDVSERYKEIVYLVKINQMWKVLTSEYA